MVPHKFSYQVAVLTLIGCCLFSAPVVYADSKTLGDANKAVRMQQFEQAFSLYKKAAKAGNAHAQYQLASMLLQGLGSQKNERKAAQWLRKATAQNHPGAQFALSQITEGSPKEVQALLKASAEQGYAPAINQLKRKSSVDTTHIASSFEKQWLGAARKDQASVMKALLTDKSKLNTTDGSGRNALFYAAEFNSQKALNWLLKKGIDVNHKDNLGLTALQTAIERDHTSIVKSLIRAGSDSEQRYMNGDNLLHYVIRLKRHAYVSQLIQTGVPINHQNNDGWTPLDIAEFQKSDSTVAMLLRKGAKRGSGWQSGRGPQDLNAVSRQLEQSTRLTPSAMAIINSNEELLVRLVQKNHEVVNQSLENGNTLLTLAVRQNKTKMVKTLLALGTNVNKAGYMGATALQIAARLNDIDTVKILLDAGASVTRKDLNNEDALLSAFREGHDAVGDVLIDHLFGGSKNKRDIKDRLRISGVPIDHYLLLASQFQAGYAIDRLLPFVSTESVTDKQQRNALWFAAQHSNHELIEKLLRAGISAQQQDLIGQTPMIIAAEKGCLTCAHKLHAASDINHQTKSGNTALILAAGKKDAEMLNWLIRKKADIDIRNQRGDTALMAAVNANDLKIAETLIAAKASITSKNKLGFSVMDLAENSSPQMVQLLKDNSVLGVF